MKNTNDNIKWIKNRGKYALNEINAMIFVISTKKMYGNILFQNKMKESNKNRVMIGTTPTELVIKPCDDDEVGSFRLAKDKSFDFIINISSVLKKDFKENDIQLGNYKAIYDEENQWFDVKLK